MESKNKPYVKQYDENGNITNAFSVYPNIYPNRHQRRAKKKVDIGLIVVNDNRFGQAGKYLSFYQHIELKHKRGKRKGQPTGEIKRIHHMLPIGSTQQRLAKLNI